MAIEGERGLGWGGGAAVGVRGGSGAVGGEGSRFAHEDEGKRGRVRGDQWRKRVEERVARGVVGKIMKGGGGRERA